MRGYDYASYGAYFVTVCVQGRLPLLGEVVDGDQNRRDVAPERYGSAVRLSPAGEMVRAVWEQVTHMYQGVGGDAYVIMPNHVHAIMLLTGPDDPVGATLRGCPQTASDFGDSGQGDVFPGRGMVRHRNGDPAPTEDGVGATLRRRPQTVPDGDDSARGEMAGATDGVRAITVGDVVGRFKTYTTRLYGEGVAAQGLPPYQGRLWQRNYHEHIIRNERELGAIREYIQNNPAQWALDRENPDRW